MNAKIKEILTDRIEVASDFPREDYDHAGWADLMMHICGLKLALSADIITDEAEGTLLDYGDRDGWEGHRPAINRALALSGRLEKDDPRAQYLGRRPKTCTVNGQKYIAAV